MNPIERLFDRMDAWRHLPSYQLERRADLFFSLYIPQALEAKLGLSVGDVLVPEFPVRIGTIYPDIPIHKSYKIDYLALADKGRQPVFVELKTDGSSRRDSQDAYLRAAQSTGLGPLLEGVLEICEATSAKAKYGCLLSELARMGLVALDGEGPVITAAARQCCRPLIVYIQPNGQGDDVVSFEDFARVVASYDDPLSKRFVLSLAKWAGVMPGQST